MTELNKEEGWFKLHNKFIDIYASHLSTAESMVYLVMLRHRDNGGDLTYPISQRTIGEKTGLTRETVNKATKQLISHNFIRIIKMPRAKGKWEHNVYELIDHYYWMPPCEFKSHSSYKEPCEICLRNGVKNSHTKKTNNKKSNKDKYDFLNHNRKELASLFKINKRNSSYG